MTCLTLFALTVNVWIIRLERHKFVCLHLMIHWLLFDIFVEGGGFKGGFDLLVGGVVFFFEFCEGGGYDFGLEQPVFLEFAFE